MAAGDAGRTSGPAPHLRAPAWAAIEGLRHGFFGRGGGVSRGSFASLNLSARVGDDAECVSANWAAVAETLPGVAIVRMQQVHGDHVAHVTTGDADVGEADGLISAQPGLGLAVLTADCVPILMVSPAARVVAAVHAGWRGTLAGIAGAAVEAGRTACGVDPGDWLAALGPSIGGCCYEVDTEIGAAFCSRWGSAMREAWQPAGGRGQLDLRRANREILIVAGVPSEGIVDIGPCTACSSDELFSHRRSGGRTGRQLSVIAWT